MSKISLYCHNVSTKWNFWVKSTLWRRDYILLHDNEISSLYIKIREKKVLADFTETSIKLIVS